MNIELLLIFIALNILNVIIQTAKSLITIKCGKTVAAIANAVAYGLYTIVLVYTMCDLPLWAKAIVVGACNLVGVYVVKLVEEKMRKDKLWKIEATVPIDKSINFEEFLCYNDLSYSIIEKASSQYDIYNIFCKTQAESVKAKTVLKEFSCKYFVSESKIL